MEDRGLVITSGEPSGIGPDLIIQLSARGLLGSAVILADPRILAERAVVLGLDIKLAEYSVGDPIQYGIGKINVLPIKSPVPVHPGRADPRNSEYVLELINQACMLCLDKRFAAMVTTPVSKSCINEADIKFSGHTEYIAAKCNCHAIMLLACEALKIALVTTHLPLAEVNKCITPERLRKTLEIVHTDLSQRFNIHAPKILVCGLNPHAGEDGYLGTEEQHIITPIVEELAQQGLDVNGPVSADTAFNKKNRQHFDVFVCMYHDQGLPVLKSLCFNQAVNISLGLPIIRTSVDHGTAFDLAGTGKANPASLYMAIQTATQLASDSEALTCSSIRHL